jgi:hypothetical protein
MVMYETLNYDAIHFLMKFVVANLKVLVMMAT